MRKYCLVLAMLAAGMKGNAQNALSSLTFEAPQKLITAKGETANVREKPSLKAPIVDVGYEDEAFLLKLNNYTLYPVIGEVDGWYEVKITYPLSEVWGYEETTGFVSKSVVRESPSVEYADSIINPAKVCKDNRYMDLPKGVLWVLSRTANPDYFMLTQMYYDNYTLWLGKIVDNVLVFKYPVHWNFICDNKLGDRILADDEENLYYSEKGPLINENNRATGWQTIFQFDNFNDAMLERLFRDAINEGRNGAVYYNAEWIETL